MLAYVLLKSILVAPPKLSCHITTVYSLKPPLPLDFVGSRPAVSSSAGILFHCCATHSSHMPCPLVSFLYIPFGSLSSAFACAPYAWKNFGSLFSYKKGLARCSLAASPEFVRHVSALCPSFARLVPASRIVRPPYIRLVTLFQTFPPCVFACRPFTSCTPYFCPCLAFGRKEKKSS